MIRLLLPLILIFLSGCSPETNVIKQNEISKDNAPIWSVSKNGLRIGISIPKNELNIEARNKVKLYFHNISEKPIRIYFLKGYYFRSFQSFFYLETNEKKNQFISPLSPPHGYVVDEKDFHLINPSKMISFESTVNISNRYREKFTNGSQLTWVYKNSITKWKGGLNTLNGPTKELFNGETIPYIWTGRTEVEIPVTIKKDL